jgi:hypothetical protein
MCSHTIFAKPGFAKFAVRAIIAPVSEQDNGTKAGFWTDVPRQLKQKRCHECGKRTFYWLFEPGGAICTDCVNLRTMQKPIPRSEPMGANGNGKKSRSTIAPAKKIAILAKRATGASKGAISREIGVAFNTVTKVLNENDFDRAVEQGRFDSVRLIPVALRGLEKSMGKGDGQVCTRFLENVGVLAEKSGKRAQDPSLVLAIQNLMGNVTLAAPQAAPIPAVDAEVVSSSASPSSSQP